MVKPISRSRRVKPSAAPCGHCGAARLVAPLDVLVGLNRRSPVPGLAPVFAELAMLGGPQVSVALCPKCYCITSELSGCAHG